MYIKKPVKILNGKIVRKKSRYNGLYDNKILVNKNPNPIQINDKNKKSKVLNKNSMGKVSTLREYFKGYHNSNMPTACKILHIIVS